MNTQPDDLTDVSLDACAEALFEADKRMWLSGPNFSDLHEVDKMRCRMMARAVLSTRQVSQITLPSGWRLEDIGPQIHIHTPDGKWTAVGDETPYLALIRRFLADLLACSDKKQCVTEDKSNDHRSSFEVWAALRWLPLNRNDIGGASYQNGDTDLAWRAWQAGATNDPPATWATGYQFRHISESGYKEDWRTVRRTTFHSNLDESVKRIASLKKKNGQPMYEIRKIFIEPYSPAQHATE